MPKEDNFKKIPGQSNALDDERDFPENITEVDEAAQSAEGLSNMEDHLDQEVKEDRDQTPPDAIDIPPSQIIR